MYSLGCARVTTAPTTMPITTRPTITHQLRASVVNQDPTSMLVLSSLLMRSSGGGGCLAPVYRRRVGPAAGRTGGSPAAALEVGAHALEDLEVVVRELAAVEVLEHVAAAVLAEPPPLLR